MPSASPKPALPDGVADLSGLVDEPTCTDVWCPDEQTQQEAEDEMKSSTQ